MNTLEIEKVAEKHFIEIMKYHNPHGNKNLAILSIDIQTIFLEKIWRKRNFLEVYHNKIKDLAKKNNISFIYSGYKREGKCLNQKEEDLFFSKNGGISSIENNPDLVSFLEDNNINTVYCIGLYRKACVLLTMEAFIHDLKLNVITSFSGTGHSLEGYNWHSKNKKKQGYDRLLELQKYGLIILDYVSK